MTAIPKPRPALLERRERAKNQAIIDKVQRAKCRQRSGGRCEVTFNTISAWIDLRQDIALTRCLRRASENHHLISGIGRRNRGKSILAEHRIEVCSICHAELTGHVLQPVGPGREDAATVRFERVR